MSILTFIFLSAQAKALPQKKCNVEIKTTLETQCALKEDEKKWDRLFIPLCYTTRKVEVNCK